jgi:hypothetical protein
MTRQSVWRAQQRKALPISAPSLMFDAADLLVVTIARRWPRKRPTKLAVVLVA